jgi:Ca-activated chloride channel family protein
MNEAIANLHFLRPLWLLLLPALALLLWLLRQPGGSLLAWQKVCDNHLLAHLTAGKKVAGSRWPLVLLGLAWLIGTLALAGPVWQKRPLPLFKTIAARVIVLDLSRSMLATDLQPSRLHQARYKMADLLDRSDEGQVALVAYAGEAFVVSPLTQDARTIKSMLGSMEPDIMPVQGSELGEALGMAGDLLTRVGSIGGDVLLLTDAPGDGAVKGARNLVDQGYRLSVLGVGTPQGAPIPERNGAFFKDSSGSIVVPRLDEGGLRDLSSLGGGRYARITTDDSDLDYLLAPFEQLDPQGATAVDQESEQWREEGPWLILLLLPLVAFGFRRGWLAAFLVVAFLPPMPARASAWDNLWQRSDQQAAQALEEGRLEDAARLAEDPMIRGNAQFKNGDFNAATQAYGFSDKPDGHYNRGNALARQSRLEEAIAAYDKALLGEPEMEDALYNKQLLEELLQQQQEQQQEDSEEQQDGESQDGESEQGESEQQDGEQQEGESEEGEQQDGEQSEGEEEAEQQPAEARLDEEMSAEERQAVEQWLRRIPDDPGGLLRRKFLLEYQRRGSPQPTTDEDW